MRLDMIKIIFFDIDGTLIDINSRKISEKISFFVFRREGRR